MKFLIGKNGKTAIGLSPIADILKKTTILETLPLPVPDSQEVKHLEAAFTFKIEHPAEVPEEGALQVNLLIHLHRQEEAPG